MHINLFLKTSVIWFIIAILAVVNGMFRESILVSNLGPANAMIVSGMLLCIIVFIVTYISFPLFAAKNTLTYLLIGLYWVIMTLVFEFLFSYYVLRKSWLTILHVFDITKGDLFSIVLIVSLISPVLVAKMKSR